MQNFLKKTVSVSVLNQISSQFTLLYLRSNRVNERYHVSAN